jgi:Putative lumazine-binding
MPMPGIDDDEIRAVARSYVEGMISADESALRAAFHPSASIIGNYQGAVEWLPVDGFIAEVLAVGASAPAEDAWEFVSLDITGDAAVAKTRCAYAGAQFTDYLSLLKIEGRWKIVAKLYRLHG